MTLLLRLRDDESGFSLTELLTAMVIGSIVLWALMTLMTTGLNKSIEVTDRAEAAQNARSAMDRMTTLLDSSMCLDPIASATAIPPLIGSSTNPTVAGSDGNYAAFYADLNGVSDQPDKYTLTYDPVADTITENRFDSSGTLPNITIATTASTTRVLATNVVPTRDPTNNTQQPIFRYYRFVSSGAINPTPMGTPIAAIDAASAVRVVIAFQVVPRRTNKESRVATTLEGQSALGTPDPNTPNAGACP